MPLVESVRVQGQNSEAVPGQDSETSFVIVAIFPNRNVLGFASVLHRVLLLIGTTFNQENRGNPAPPNTTTSPWRYLGSCWFQSTKPWGL